MKQETALGILKTGRNVYLTGAAGAGKTYVLNQYIDYLKKHYVSIGITASTGIAATHIGGMTIHSWSGIGVKDYLSDWDLDSLTERQPLVKRIERTSVLVIDEFSMLGPNVLDMVDRVTKTIRRSEEPFGGMQVILCGDFFQLPPVGQMDQFADSARAWLEGDFRVCYLTEQYRQKGGKLLHILNDIRDGEISEPSREALEERMSDDSEPHKDAVVLHTHNQNVDTRNDQELDKLKEDSVIYEMTSTGSKSRVETLKKSVLAPPQLELKVGARVMFVKNAPDQEYVNGTLGEVTDIEGDYPVIKTNDGKIITAHPVSWEMADDGKVLASVTQVPLRLAWAITIHKSQGMSLDNVEVDLSRAFTPGQGYVALSRARTLEGLTLHGLNETALQVHPYVSMRDEQLRANSDKWEDVFTKFSPEKIKSMQDAFIARVGRESAPETERKMPTHLITMALLVEGKSIQDIAAERGVTEGTIINHILKLAEGGDTQCYTHLKPDAQVLFEIEEAFKSVKDQKLTPIHRKLKGKYSFDELRLARLFIEV